VREEEDLLRLWYAWMSMAVLSTGCDSEKKQTLNFQNSLWKNIIIKWYLGKRITEFKGNLRVAQLILSFGPGIRRFRFLIHINFSSP
jgi:hypothetical protein